MPGLGENVDRREFLKFGGVAAMELSAAKLLLSQSQPGTPGMQAGSAPSANEPKADFTLRIAPVTVELTPTRVISTIGYNGTSPGPVLRMKEGKPVTVEVINETDVPELVHWHGLFLPAEVDGVEEENTPMVPPHGRIRYQFTPRPAGTRWYHTHTMAGPDLHRGSYTGQFGFLMIEGANNPAATIRKFFLRSVNGNRSSIPKRRMTTSKRTPARSLNAPRSSTLLPRASKLATRCFPSTTRPWVRESRFAYSRASASWYTC